MLYHTKKILNRYMTGYCMLGRLKKQTNNTIHLKMVFSIVDLLRV